MSVSVPEEEDAHVARMLFKHRGNVTVNVLPG